MLKQHKKAQCRPKIHVRTNVRLRSQTVWLEVTLNAVRGRAQGAAE